MRSGLCWLAVAVSCAGQGEDTQVARHAALELRIGLDDLRVTSQSDLTGEAHHFYLITTDKDATTLVVVVPRMGPMFDSHTPDAFDRVARAEGAAEHLGQLGAERVAGWFAALGGGRCPPTPSDKAHFATAVRAPDGSVRLSYEAPGVHKTCVLELNPDGGLKQARTLEEPRAQSQRGWGSSGE